VYYWHCREQIGKIKKGPWTDPVKQDEALKKLEASALCDLRRHRLLRAVHLTMIKCFKTATRWRTVAREAGEADCSEQCVNQKLSRWLPVDPRLKPSEILFIAASPDSGARASLQLGIGPRPVLLPPGFQLVGKIGLAVLMEAPSFHVDGRINAL
jgi:hypothetical protein